jgi:NAD(P)-dependent dehydrogenase (short-subunit alcohol dehydrogenase family)
MDLGFAGSTAVATGGSKGMGLAIAETLAAEGASVAVMARSQGALDAAVTSLLEAGAPDAVGISVDMADAQSIIDGFAAVSERWGRLNSLVHTIGPGDGYFEQMDDIQWDACVRTGHDVGCAIDPRLVAAAALRGVGTDCDAVRALDSAAEPADCGLHGIEGGIGQRHQELIEKPC